MGDDQSRIVYCPDCGNVAIMSMSGFGVRHDCLDCGLWSYGGKRLVNKATHSARIRAHDVFDPLWKDMHPLPWEPIMTRSEAYAALAKLLGMQSKHCHFGEMSLKELIHIPAAVRVIRAQHALKNKHQPVQEAQQED